MKSAYTVNNNYNPEYLLFSISLFLLILGFSYFFSLCISTPFYFLLNALAVLVNTVITVVIIYMGKKQKQGYKTALRFPISLYAILIPTSLAFYYGHYLEFGLFIFIALVEFFLMIFVLNPKLNEMVTFMFLLSLSFIWIATGVIEMAANMHWADNEGNTLLNIFKTWYPIAIFFALLPASYLLSKMNWKKGLILIYTIAFFVLPWMLEGYLTERLSYYVDNFDKSVRSVATPVFLISFVFIPLITYLMGHKQK